MKQSFAWWCFANKDLPAQELLSAAASIGYSGVDLIPQELWPLAAQCGLSVTAINGHRSIELGLNRREERQRIIAEISANIKLAQQWRIPNLICFSGARAGLDDATGIEITAEALSQVASLAEQSGVMLTLELLNSKIDHHDYQCDHTAWGVKVCQLVGSPNVRLLYDIYHMQSMEGDIIRTIQEQSQWFAHYHTAGNPGRLQIDKSQELNYAPIFAAIAQTGFTGFISHEFLPSGDPIVELETAFAICAATS